MAPAKSATSVESVVYPWIDPARASRTDARLLLRPRPDPPGTKGQPSVLRRGHQREYAPLETAAKGPCQLTLVEPLVAGIELEVLDGRIDPAQLSVATRMKWTLDRITRLILAVDEGKVYEVQQLSSFEIRKFATPPGLGFWTGLTLLHWAMTGGHTEMVQHLLDAGVSIESTDCCGLSASYLRTSSWHPPPLSTWSRLCAQQRYPRTVGHS